MRVGCCLLGIQSVSHWVDIKLSISTFTEAGCIPFSVLVVCLRVRSYPLPGSRLLLVLTMASLCVDAEQRNKMQRAGAPAARALNEGLRRFHNKLVESACLLVFFT